MMPWTRYKVIHHTMLHYGEVDETCSKNKIELFLDKLHSLDFKKFFTRFRPYRLMECWLNGKVVGGINWGTTSVSPVNTTPTFLGYVTALQATARMFWPTSVLKPFTLTLRKGAGESEKIFEYLFHLLGKGHHIYADRYYTTHSLIRYLTFSEWNQIGKNKTPWNKF